VDRESTAIPLGPARRGWLAERVARLAAAGSIFALTRAHALAIGATFALAVLLRLHGLGSWPLEADEVFSYHRAFDLDRVNARPLYFFIQRLVLETLPHEALYMRLPAFAFGLAGVWATWALGRRVFGATAGWIAAALVALSPWHIYVSQLARYWSLVYLIAALLYLLLPAAVDRDRRRTYLAVLALVLIGVTAHPTTVFPLAGFVLGLHLVRASGDVAWRWPSRRAWLALWAPLVAVALLGIGALAATGNLDALRNGDTRGIAVTIRLVPAIVQWASPVVIAAAISGGVGLLAASPADRRWAASALLGAATGTGLLLAASLVTAVYSDYAISILPLAFVTIGGAVQRLGEALGRKGARIAVGASLAVLVAGVLPGTVSHASDGTRLDPRPAHEHIRAVAERGVHAPVFAPVPELHRFYSPALPFVELPSSTARLERALVENGGFWLIGFYHREGLVLAGHDVDDWIRAHCHSVLRTQRPRLDYRVYRVELHWCGHDRRPDARVTP